MADAKRYEITVLPKAQYVADQSDPDKNQFVFAYTIRITNTGTVSAQLVSRHWVIVDADQRVQEVKGLGPFAAELVVLRGAAAPDALPSSERRLADEVTARYGSDRTLVEVADAWRPYRTWAAFSLRVLAEHGAGGSA